MLFEHIGVIRQLLQIGAYGIPIRLSEIFLKAFLKGRLIPSAALLGLVKNTLILQEITALDILCSEIFRQIGLDTAFCGVDLKSREDGKRFCFLSAFLLGLGVDILVVGNDTAVKCRIGNLTDTGRKCPELFSLFSNPTFLLLSVSNLFNC